MTHAIDILLPVYSPTDETRNRTELCIRSIGDTTTQPVRILAHVGPASICKGTYDYLHEAAHKHVDVVVLVSEADETPGGALAKLEEQIDAPLFATIHTDTTFLEAGWLEFTQTTFRTQPHLAVTAPVANFAKDRGAAVARINPSLNDDSPRRLTFPRYLDYALFARTQAFKQLNLTLGAAHMNLTPGTGHTAPLESTILILEPAWQLTLGLKPPWHGVPLHQKVAGGIHHEAGMSYEARRKP